MFPINIHTFRNEYRFDFHKNQSETLIISFNHWGSVDLNSPGFDDKFLVNSGADILFCKTNSNDWFCGLNQYLIDGIQKSIGTDYKEIIFYGSSMGAYAAIYFSCFFKNAKAIAISPQYTPNTSKVAFEKRWIHEWSKISNMHLEFSQISVSPGVKIDIIYDPFDIEDAKHAEMIKSAMPDFVSLHRFSFTGHPSGYALNRAGIYRDILQHIISGEGVPPQIHDSWIRFINNDNSAYINRVVHASRISMNEFYRTFFSFTNSNSALTFSPDALIKIAQNLQEKQHNLQRALCRAALFDTINPHIYAYTALILARDGFISDAKYNLQRALEIDKSNDIFKNSLECLDGDEKTSSFVIATMQKNEGLLLLSWTFYYIQIVGSENILILDNGSDEEQTLVVLNFIEKLGVTVIKEYNKNTDFEKKGMLILHECRRHFGMKNIFPIDCDEFFYDASSETLSFDPSRIMTVLTMMQSCLDDSTRLIRIEDGRLNVPNNTAVMPWKAKRLLINSGYTGYLDVGLHLYDWQSEMDLSDKPIPIEKNIGVLHCHYRSFEETVSKARLKLQGRVKSFSEEDLKNHSGAGMHLIPYLLMNKDDYYDGFLSREYTDISVLWRECHIPFPFSSVVI